MKSIKILSLVAMLFIGLSSCENPDDGGQSVKGLVNEWALTSWCGAEPQFNVYVNFKEDGTFEMYQQVYSLDYELYDGTYTLSGDTLTGVYSDGEAWNSSYKVSIKGGDTATLTLTNASDANMVSVYAPMPTPEDVKAEATATRGVEVERFL